MPLKLLIALLFLPSFVKAQYAVFTTDTNFHSEQDQVHNEWIIAGKRLTYGGAPIKVKVDNVLDTIFFRTDIQRPWDTIICQISRAETFYFVYNDCCGGFYIADSNKRFFHPLTIFTISKSDKKHLYIGKLGDDGALINRGDLRTDTLKISCHSPLQPNVFYLSFEQIEINNDTTLSLENACLETDNDINYEFNYISLKSYCNFLYMPLSHAPVTMVISRKRGLVTIVNGD